MSLFSATLATSRRTGSKPLMITASGVSSTIRSIPVACWRARMLRPSLPMMRPFSSSVGSGSTETETSAVWSAAMRWIDSVTISRARRSLSSRAASSDSRTLRATSLRRSCSTCAIRIP